MQARRRGGPKGKRRPPGRREKMQTRATGSLSFSEAWPGHHAGKTHWRRSARRGS